MRVVDWFIEQCQRSPETVALRILEQCPTSQDFTWGELEQLVHQTTRLLQSRADGIVVGDRVATYLPNGLSWILVDLACQWMGWVHVALDTRLPINLARDLAEHSEATLLVVSHNCLADIQSGTDSHTSVLTAVELESRVAREAKTARPIVPLRVSKDVSAQSIEAHAAAQILYTSGTIGQPKGVVLSHTNLLSNARAKLQAAPQYHDDVRLNILPFAHAYARTCELSAWIISGSQLCIAKDWASFLIWAPIINPTLINLVPHLVTRLLEQLDRTTLITNTVGNRLRLLQVGGAALRSDVWQRLADLGWPPLQGYGLTETSPVICSNRAGRQQRETVGPPVEGVEIRLDTDGVLWTRGPHVMLGYWRAPEATRARMRDGWFCTGDIAEQSDDGSLLILGRMDDQITLTTGYKVAPLELAARLSADGLTDQIVIVGQDRPFIGALVFCRRREGSDDANLIATITERWRPLTCDLPRFMQIERIALMNEPLTVENGGLNFKGAIRRKFVEETLCQAAVENIYSGAD